MAYNKYQNKFLMAVALASLFSVPVAFADNSISAWHEDPLRLNVKFERQTSAFSQQEYSSEWMSEFDSLSSASGSRSKYSLDSKMLRQYDATISYPFQRGKFNFDLGLNIKFINGVTESADELGVVSSQSYNATLPMMYGTALYDLPWKGVSAGIEGKHMVFDSSSAYDYKAMLTYQSRNGFGLNGGWQYKQLHLDAFQNITANSETDGPFVDVYFKF